MVSMVTLICFYVVDGSFCVIFGVIFMFVFLMFVVVLSFLCEVSCTSACQCRVLTRKNGVRSAFGPPFLVKALGQGGNVGLKTQAFKPS